MSIRIALVGNPNSGKTTLFNALTGMNQYVGNWPGVTVEKKEGRIKSDKIKADGEVILTDLPGIYSLSPYTPEEVVARNYLTEERPDAIINVVDGTNLERNLYLTTQLCELGIPVVIALNMMDIVRKKGDIIDVESLSRVLDCQIVEISALKNKGIDLVAQAAISSAGSKRDTSVPVFSEMVENAIDEVKAVSGICGDLERWHLVKTLERDRGVVERLSIDKVTLEKIEEIIVLLEKSLDDDIESIITDNRYVYITNTLKDLYKRSEKPSVTEKIDSVLTHRIFALPIFVLVMLGVYAISIGTIGSWTVDFMNETLFATWIIPNVSDALISVEVAPWLVSLIADGIIGGVGAVLGFVPQMMILFLLLSLLEDCGYMSRVAFIMDRLFRRLGLSGKSFIPLLVASGCGVPGVMASRTIDQERDRKMTIITTCFIPCGAKTPIIGLIAGAFFGGSAIIATAAYFIGIAAVVLSGIMLKKLKAFSGDPAPFVMELPSYHAPVPTNILRTTFERGWSFIKKAGTVILLASIVIWVLNSLSFEGGLHYITETNGGVSVLEMLGTLVSWIFAPLGFGYWEAVVATITGLVAKEGVVSVFEGLGNMSAEANAYATFEGNGLSGFSFMVFNLLCAPCFAAMGAIKREMNDWRWTAFAIGYMTVFAYCMSLIVYQLGMLFTGNGNIVGSVASFVLIGILCYFLFRKDGFSLIDLIRNKKKSSLK